MPQVGGNPIREFLPADYWSRWFDFFVYGFDLNPLQAGAVNQPAQFTVDQDSDFLVQGIAVVAVTEADETAEEDFPPVTVQLQDSASGAVWFSAPQHIANIAGRNAVDGPGVTRLEVPRWIAAAATVTGEFSNLDAANAFRVWVAFRGAKIYRSMRRNYGG
jgi:hypothetical protein